MRFVRAHPVIATVCGVVVLSVLLVTGTVAWWVHSSNVRGDRYLDSIEATGGPAAVRRLGIVVGEEHERGAVIEGDGPSITLRVRASGSRGEVIQRVDEALRSAGYEPVGSIDAAEGGYYRRDRPGNDRTVGVYLRTRTNAQGRPETTGDVTFT